MSEPTFFKTAAEWRKWLEKNHDKTTEKLVGFHKVGSGKAGITYKEALDEALCFGWIDGVARGGDATWQIRFSPRRKRSIWSEVNITRVAELTAEGRMHPAGIAAFEARDPARQNRYSGENRKSAFAAERGADVSRQQARPGRTSAPAAVLSPAGDMVGDERQAGGDARAAARDADRGFVGRTPDQADDAAEAKDVMRLFVFGLRLFGACRCRRACGRGWRRSGARRAIAEKLGEIEAPE